MALSLDLKRYAPTNIDYAFLGASRLRIEATDPNNTGADPYVFLYLRGLPDVVTGQTPDYCMGVASAVDMSYYPAGEPNDDTEFPIFRLDFFELDFRTAGQAQSAWLTVVAEVTVLLEALEKLDVLSLAETVTIGNPGDSGNSESSSESTSSSESSSDSTSV